MNLRLISNEAIMEAGNITKAATFESFLHLSYKSQRDIRGENTITFFVTVFFNIFMCQTLTDVFWGLRKNVNCVSFKRRGYLIA